MTKGEEHPAIEGVHSSMIVLGILSHVPWLLNMAGKIPGAAAAYQEFFSWCGSEIEAKKKVGPLILALITYGPSDLQGF